MSRATPDAPGYPLDIDERITHASTPPARFYTDPAAWAAVRARVFARSWQFLADTEMLKVPGQVHPQTLLEGLLDEPLLWTRDADDRLHCLSNVCTHRGMLVADGPGVEKALRCRYHGRRFGLDGAFQYMPEFEGVANFPAPCDDLPKFAWGQWGPLLFAGFDPAVPLEEMLAPMQARLAWLPLHEFRFDAQRSRDYLVQAHWALYVENYLEGFHIPYVHAALNEVLDYGAYTTELYPGCNLQLATHKTPEGAFDLPQTSPDYGRNIVAYYWWVFPNLMFNFYPWGLSINVVKPLAPDRTRVSFLAYVWDAAKLQAGAGAGLDRVEREDEAVVEAVQRGLRSARYDRGRYAPVRELGTHHFHRQLAAALRG